MNVDDVLDDNNDECNGAEEALILSLSDFKDSEEDDDEEDVDGGRTAGPGAIGGDDVLDKLSISLTTSRISSLDKVSFFSSSEDDEEDENIFKWGDDEVDDAGLGTVLLKIKALRRLASSDLLPSLGKPNSPQYNCRSCLSNSALTGTERTTPFLVVTTGEDDDDDGLEDDIRQHFLTAMSCQKPLLDNRKLNQEKMTREGKQVNTPG